MDILRLLCLTIVLFICRIGKTDGQNNAPVITNLPSSPVVSIPLPEDTSVGQSIFQVTATDQDDRNVSDNGVLFFVFAYGTQAEKFSIDVEGNIYVAQPLDYETTISYTLSPIVSDLGNPPMIDSGLLEITIQDVNDNEPTCSPNNLLIQIKENTPNGTLVGKLNCSDVDTGPGGDLTYEVVLFTGDEDTITVDSAGQVFPFRGDIDYDTEKHNFSLLVRVKDNGASSLSATATVIFTISDEDDNPPMFPQTMYTISVDETAPIGTTVIRVTADDIDEPNTPATTITYGLETFDPRFQSACNPDVFSIDSKTGDIYLKQKLDRDSYTQVECRPNACSSKLATRTSSTVIVTINDINDRYPEFIPQNIYNTSILETAGPPDPVFTVMATDPDGGIITYSIESGTIFDIDPVSGEITLNAPLDYETQRSYLIEINATDDGTPSLTSPGFLQVLVLPFNEFTPLINGTLEHNITEDAPPGSIVFLVSAFDDDAGLDGTLTYELTDPTLPFQVDATNGVVKVAGSGLDYEQVKEYQVEIRVRDNSAATQLSALQTYKVSVLDVDDRAITCSTDTTFLLTFPFNVGGIVRTVGCQDDDVMPQTLDFNITSGNDEGTFEIVPGTGELRLLNSPLSNRYDFAIDVTDGVDNVDTTLTIFTETELTFLNLPNDTTVMEEAPGFTIWTVSTCCAFPVVSYSILTGNADGRVRMGRTSGQLQLFVPYDREVTDLYEYVIQAVSDSGQSATSTFTVTVEDINDNTPQFPESAYSISLDENLAPSTIISRYAATDLDTGPNADITYVVASGFGGGEFSLDPVTGDLSLASSLDFEATASYTLVIDAVDQGTPARTGSTTVLIIVKNNDDFPLKIIPMSALYFSTLSEDSALGYSVFRLQASDSDTGAVITYSIDSGNTDGDFGIQPVSGIIYLQKFLDRERTPSYTLTVAAENQIGDKETGTLTIDIIDVNDNNPVFTMRVYNFDVVHNLNTGQPVGDVAVSDIDDGVNGAVTLSLTGQMGAFVLKGMTIETNTVMDYTTVPRYRFKVIGTDGATPPRAGTAVVVVNVLPDLLTPEYVPNSGATDVIETEEIGTQIYDVNATNLGAPEDGTITYTIIGGNGNGDFMIRPSTGEIIIEKSLDFEANMVYNLQIQAEISPNSDTFDLTVNIINVNDNSPEFRPADYSFGVPENAAFNAPVGTVTATDDDMGTFGAVTLTMMGMSTDFIMDSNTGEISVRGALDYLTMSTYNYIVAASDGGTPAKTAVASIVIRIEDVNNHEPNFTSPTTTSVLDSSPIGSEFFRVRATDLDSGDAGNVSYAVTVDPSSGAFSLAQYSGVLTTAMQLDAAVTPSYILTIEASDAGTPSSLTATTSLTINVISSNPNYNDPAFNLTSPVTVTIPRTSPGGTLVIDAEATDSDNGISGEVVHKIISGNTDGYFVINRNTGVITTATSLLEAENSYTLEVMAMDKGKPSRNSTLEVIVNVAPQATTSIVSDYMFTVSEDAPVSTTVGTIDVDPGRTVTVYNIDSGNYNNVLAITLGGGMAGELIIATMLDYEVYPSYTLLVSVTSDIGVFTKVVQVEVTDIDDEPPTFAPVTYTFNVPEFSPSGFSVGMISFTDADTTAVNRDNSLTLSNPGPTNFAIDDSGLLTVSTPLDFASVQTVTFEAVATSNQDPLLSSRATININVIDVEETETAPLSQVTDNAIISLEVHYQAPEGHVIYTLVPADFGLAITPDPSTVIEYVSYPTTNPLSVSSATGDITVSGELADQSMYLHWVMIRILSGGTVTTEVVLIRLDTFDRDTQMAVIEYPETLDFVETNLQQFITRAQVFFRNTQRFGISNVFDSSTGSRRRLLATMTAAFSYVVSDTSVDDMANVNQPKTFLTEQQILNVLQQSADGTPTAGLSDPSRLTVQAVEPFQATEESDEEFENFATSTEGIVVWVLLGLLLLVLLAILAICLYRYCKKRKGKGHMNDNRNRDNSFSRVSDKTPSASSSHPPHATVLPTSMAVASQTQPVAPVPATKPAPAYSTNKPDNPKPNATPKPTPRPKVAPIPNTAPPQQKSNRKKIPLSKPPPSAQNARQNSPFKSKSNKSTPRSAPKLEPKNEAVDKIPEADLAKGNVETPEVSPTNGNEREITNMTPVNEDGREITNVTPVNNAGEAEDGTPTDNGVEIVGETVHAPSPANQNPPEPNEIPNTNQDSPQNRDQGQ